MRLDVPRILKAILAQYSLPLDGDHGVGHWAEVTEIISGIVRFADASAFMLDLRHLEIVGSTAFYPKPHFLCPA